MEVALVGKSFGGVSISVLRLYFTIDLHHRFLEEIRYSRDTGLFIFVTKHRMGL